MRDIFQDLLALAPLFAAASLVNAGDAKRKVRAADSLLLKTAEATKPHQFFMKATSCYFLSSEYLGIIIMTFSSELQSDF